MNSLLQTCLSSWFACFTFTAEQALECQTILLNLRTFRLYLSIRSQILQLPCPCKAAFSGHFTVTVFLVNATWPDFVSKKIVLLGRQ